MNSFSELSRQFDEHFKKRHFPNEPARLYDAAQHLLELKGKRVRPACVLMAAELFSEITDDAWHAATAVELFHNFTLVHDDIMDKAPSRRGAPTVHTKFGESTALLAGDVLLVEAYEQLNKVTNNYRGQIVSLFNKTAKEVCEGQQRDMEFEARDSVGFNEYLSMITLKTSVLLAGSLAMGALLGGAGLGNQQHIYAFGNNLGIAFQVQDDYLDAFGDPVKFGKQVGGDILSGKKTFLMIYALEAATDQQRVQLKASANLENGARIDAVLEVYKACGVDQWAKELRQKYYQDALMHLEELAVVSSRKQPLADLAALLMNREA